MKTKINITIDQNTLVKTDNEARACDMSRSEFVNSVLNDWFSTKDYIKNSLPEILKGIEDIKVQLSNFNIDIDSDCISPCGGSETEVRNPEGNSK